MQVFPVQLPKRMNPRLARNGRDPRPGQRLPAPPGRRRPLFLGVQVSKFCAPRSPEITKPPTQRQGAFLSRPAYLRSVSRISISTSSSVGPLGAAASAAAAVASFFATLSFSLFTAFTSRNTTQAMIRKLMTAVMNDP